MPTSQSFILAVLIAVPALDAQRVRMQGNDLVLENPQGRPISLGKGFNPIPISQNKFLIIRGRQMRYGEESSCERPDTRNRVVIYDTTTHKDSVLFDKPISNPELAPDGACVYEHADLSPSESTLYIVSPCYATSGCLAVIDLATGKAKYIPGAMDVFVIRGGPQAGDLLYMRRLFRKPTNDDPGGPYYPYIHARPDGSQVAIISNEDLVLVGGNAPAPILRSYLQHINGRIYVQGEWVP